MRSAPPDQTDPPVAPMAAPRPAEPARPAFFEDEGLIRPIFTNPFDFE